MPVLKNPKHERFAQELAKGKTIDEACDAAEITLKLCSNLTGYYVYLLMDPRDRRVFYVGKGKNRRAFHHAAEWKTGKIINGAKFERIGGIIRAGRKVQARCLVDGLTEEAALDTEKWLIAAVGRDLLTNALRGPGSETAKNIAGLREALKRLRPFCRWKEKILWQVRDKSATDEQRIANYWDWVADVTNLLAVLEKRPTSKVPTRWRTDARAA